MGIKNDQKKISYYTYFKYGSNYDCRSIFFKSDAYNLMLYKNTVKQSNYIRHALGGLDTYQYLNTIEALENSYKKGFRLFEVDVRFTSDDKLVLTHGWEEVDYIERMGIS